MDSIKSSNESHTVESTVKITRQEFKDGSSTERRVEQVEGGYIITTEKRVKNDEGYWDYITDKAVSTEDPDKDNSSEGIANRLESILKNM